MGASENQAILQKSANVCTIGPCVAMKAIGSLSYPW